MLMTSLRIRTDGSTQDFDQMMQADTICIGIDGATWDLIDPWIEAGILPTLERLRSEGVWTRNQSCLPPSTFPNWKCYSTGKNPGGFGTFWFETVDYDAHEISVPNSRSFKSAELWDYLGEDGNNVGVINVPSTYPPKEVNGYLVSGGPRSGKEAYTFPSGLETELERKFDYRVHPRQLPINKDDVDPKVVEEIQTVIDMRFEAAHHLLDQGVDFLSLTIFYINVLQHFFGDAECVKESWKRLDSQLADLEKRCEHLVVMSDHGSGKIDTVFWINTWLEQEGYLKTKSGVSDSVFRLMGEHRDRILDAARSLGAEGLLRRVTPEWLQNRIQPGGVHQKGSKAALIDWEASSAVASGQGPLYLNGADLSKSEYENLRTELIERIEAVESPLTGEPVANAVHRSEAIYSGPYVDEGPDLVVEQRDGVHTDGGIGRDIVFEGPTKWHSENYRNGIFLLHSEHGKTNEHVEQLRMTDIAPTLLHLLGSAVPTDVHGEVRTDLFDPDSPVVQREVASRKPLGDRLADEQNASAETVSRLEDLGYFS